MDEKWIEIEQLVLRAQAGDRDALGELMVRFEGKVLAIARGRNRDMHEADELVQDVFIHVMRKIGQLRNPASFGAWLQRITVRVSINRATRRPPLLTAEAEVLEQHGREADTALEDLVRKEQRDRVRSAVASLRPIDRDALEAFYLKGQSLAEIAEAFDVPLGTVKRRLHKARHRLEETLAGDGMDHNDEDQSCTEGCGRKPRSRAKQRVRQVSDVGSPKREFALIAALAD